MLPVDQGCRTRRTKAKPRKKHGSDRGRPARVDEGIRGAQSCFAGAIGIAQDSLRRTYEGSPAADQQEQRRDGQESDDPEERIDEEEHHDHTHQREQLRHENRVARDESILNSTDVSDFISQWFVDSAGACG